MGLFSKKFCDICGEKIGLLGNRKLEDGNMCKDCARKLSPWFSDRRQSTVSEIRSQLKDREENKERVKNFRVTEDLPGNREHVFLDRTQGWFSVAQELSLSENPDVLDLTCITSCYLDTREMREEETYEDEAGQTKSYSPRRYRYFYDYYIKIAVSAPWFDEITFKLNTFSIESSDRDAMRRMEEMGNKIAEALMTKTNKRPEQAGASGVTCACCGWKREDADHRPKFCPNCGHPL